MALLHTSVDNIRLISVSTGSAKCAEDKNFSELFKNVTQKSKEDLNQENLFSQWYQKTTGWLCKKSVDYLDSYKFLDDEGGPKNGPFDWLNIELLSCLAFDIQKQHDIMFQYYGPRLNHDGKRYWRLDPIMDEEVDLADAAKSPLLEQIAQDYIKNNPDEFSEIVEELLKPVSLIDKMINKLNLMVSELQQEMSRENVNED